MEGLFYFVRNPQSTYTEWGWEIWPQGLTDGIMMIKARYGDIPIYITENGLGAKDPIIDGEVVDDPRIDYLSSHIGALEKALALGADVRGYYPLVIYRSAELAQRLSKAIWFCLCRSPAKSGAETKEEFLLVQICYCQSRRTALIFSCGRHSAPVCFRIFLNFSLLFKAGFAPCHGFI